MIGSYGVRKCEKDEVEKSQRRRIFGKKHIIVISPRTRGCVNHIHYFFLGDLQGNVFSLFKFQAKYI